MKRFATVSTILLVMLAGRAPLHAQQEAPRGNDAPRMLPHRLVIKVQAGDLPPVEQARALLAPMWRSLRLRSVSSWLSPALLQPPPPRLLHKISGDAAARLGGLARIVQIEYDGALPPDLLAAKLTGITGIDYAEPVYRRTLQFVPDDALLSQQWYLEQVRAYQAWDESRADSTIIIAIVDTGIDPDHEDLRDAIWHNPGETGRDDHGRDRRSNGLDDDGNGLVDDWRGYDFGGHDGYSPDNDPAPFYWHGSHVAGIAGAIGDNAIGITGIGFGARLMSIKISDDEQYQEPLLTGGADGILYAARMGARIINCSWGGPGFSQAEQELVDVVTEMGSLVVGAAGNNGSNLSSYPASYRNVLSVAAVTPTDKRSFFSNFSTNVGISAPGEAMYSTVPRSYSASGYRRSDGTSMAAPVVAGAAALILAKYPELSPEEIVAVLRANADDISEQNPTMRHLLGSGRINIERALSVGADAVYASVLDYRVIEETPDDVIEPGERVDLHVRVKNILSPVSGLRLDLTALSDNDAVHIENGTASFGDMDHGEIRESGAGTFIVTMPGDLPLDYRLPLLLTLHDDAGEIGTRRIELMVNPNYATTAYNRSTVTFTGNGRIGFNDFPSNEQGSGFRLDTSSNLLAEGGLMIGIAAGQLADVVRSSDLLHQSQGLQTVEPYRVRFSAGEGAEIGTARFNDRHLSDLQRIGLDVRLTTRQFGPPADNLTLLSYTITNTSPALFTTLNCAMFLDWDLGPAGADDQIKCDLENRFGYVYNVRNTALPYAAAMLVSDDPMAFAALNNGLPPLTNGFYQTEKWDVISNGIRSEQSQVGDASMVIGAGPIELRPGADTTVTFALMSGANLAELRTTAQSAREIFTRMGGTPGGPVVVPRELYLAEGYPNPFTDHIDLEFRLPREDYVTIDVVNPLGEVVQTLTSSFYPKGIHSVRFIPEGEAVGVYFVRLTALNHTVARKVVRIVH